MPTRDRGIVRCTFQVEATTRLGKLLHWVINFPDKRNARDVVREAIEGYWTPVHLVAQYQQGEITDEEYRQQVLLAMARQQAWLTYCHHLTQIGPLVEPFQVTTDWLVDDYARSTKAHPIDPERLQRPESKQNTRGR